MKIEFEGAKPNTFTSTPTELVDVVNAINDKLAALPDHYLADACRWIDDPPRDRPDTGHFGGGHGGIAAITASMPAGGHSECHRVLGKLTIQPPALILVGPTVSVSEPNWKSIPNDVFTMRIHYHNCSSINQDESVTHSVVETLGETVTNTKSLQTGSSTATSINASFKIGIVGFGGSDTMTVSTQTSLSDSTTQNHTHQYQDNIAIMIHVPAMKDVDGTHSVTQYYVPVDYSGSVLVDAALSANREGLGRLSQVLSSDADRTFSFSGVITETLLRPSTDLREKPLSVSDCAEQTGQILQTTATRIQRQEK